MSAHTPGPWINGTSLHTRYGVFAGDSERGTWTICYTATANRDRNLENEANARLIAAAPELLAALAALVKKTENYDNPRDQGVSSHDDAMEAARAAIAKAEGQ